MSMFEFIVLFIKLAFMLNLIMGLASLCTWIERKGSALLQDRVGANRAGAHFDFDYKIFLSIPLVKEIPILIRGVVLPAFYIALMYFASIKSLLPLQAAVLLFAAFPLPILYYVSLYGVVTPVKVMGYLGIINTLVNDGVKAIFKEDFIPEGVSNFMHCLAPMLAVLPVFVAFAIVPLAPDFELMGHIIRPQVAPLGVGILFFLAMGSLAVYGVALAGWTGNNKYSLLGALRAAAQMISYELAMGMTIVTMIIHYGTPDLYNIIEMQKGIQWGVFAQFPAPTGILAFIILFIAGMAETKRAPFDLPESESELVAGYFTEYSGMKFLVFWLGEFAEIALFALIMVSLFFGGWHLPGLTLPENVWWASLIGHGIFMAKVVFFCTLQIVIRWTLPRFRYDHLMNLGWKILLPLSMANLVVAAALKLLS